MNPIKLEHLMQVTAAGRGTTVAIPLQPDKPYAGILLTDPVQGARLLQLNTAQGILQLRLPQSVSAPNGSAMQASFQQLPDGRVQVQLQARGEAVQSFPLNQQQALTLALNWRGDNRPVTDLSSASTATHLPVELQSSRQQSQIRLPQGMVVPLPAALHRTIQSLMVQFPQARIEASISLGTGQEPSLFLEVKTTSQARTTPLGPSMPGNLSMPKAADRSSPQTPGQTHSEPPSQRLQYQQLTLPAQLQQQLLAQVASAIQGQSIPARLQQQYLQLGNLMLPLPQVRLAAGHYQIQLQQEQQNWQLQFLSQQQNSAKLQLAKDAFNRPIQWQPAQTGTAAESAAQQQSGNKTQPVLEQGWRLLQPLLAESPARLASLPELPAPLQQALQHIRQQLPSGQRVMSGAEIQQQLQAVLQFHPLQAPANSSSAAGTFALAIQLLLGRLSRAASPMANQPAAQRLMPLLQQLDSQSAGQLLRQLASHSGAMQQSQLASTELQQQQSGQFLLQLPLQWDQQSTQLQLKIEQRDGSDNQSGQTNKVWQLTMHFDLTELGKVLATAKLDGNRLNLQIYTEQATTKTLAKQFVPRLTERLEAQGIEVAQVQCQSGAVPDSLFNRHSSLITVKA
ncbi:MAG: flagellar hook-length control protein FliK [Alkalimonas sp.]|nr:flagellar hook-length control protein FliK [Alkalimonas sp.]